MRPPSVSRTALIAALVSAMPGCGGTLADLPVVTKTAAFLAASITLSTSTNTVKVGQTAQVSAVVRDANGALMPAAPVSWSSASTAIATVSASGLVTGNAAGVATISATADTVTRTIALTIIDTVVVPPPPPSSSGVELPRVYLNTTAPAAPAAGGTVIAVPAGGNLQNALNAAQPGDVIELAKDAVFTGNFVLRNKNTTSTNWITIRPANYASLPAAGTRMTPSAAAALGLPKILNPNTNFGITTEAGAHHYRLTGLDVSVTPTNVYAYSLIALDGGATQTTLAAVPHDLVLDRLYVHGTATGTVRRCVQLNSASSAVIDSWLSECHELGADSQAIAGWNGPGPFKIVNNHLEGAGENVIFGGADPSIPNLTPSDIEIRGNHFIKPRAWKGLWTIKNLFELKNAQRVLVEGNVMEQCWQQAQNGVAIALKTVNQNGSCTWCVTQDVTVRLNFIRNVGAGINVAASPDNNFADIHARRFAIRNNLFTGINVGAFDGDGRGMLLTGDLTDVEVAHNTLTITTPGALVFGPYNTHQTGLSVHDNLWHGGLYNVIGDNLLGGAAIAYYGPGAVFKGNVMVYPPGGAGYPAGNFFPATTAAIGFVNDAAGDFRLAPSSPYKGKATDGTDPGADITLLNATIASVIVAP